MMYVKHLAWGLARKGPTNSSPLLNVSIFESADIEKEIEIPVSLIVTLLS